MEKRIEAPRTLDKDSGKAILDGMRAGRVGRGDTVVIDLSGTDRMDSQGGAWLVAGADAARSRNAEYRLEGQSGSVAEFLDFIRPGLEEQREAKRRKEGLLERIGGTWLEWRSELASFGGMLIEAVYWTFIAPLEGKKFRWGLWAEEVYEMGVRGLRINCLMNFLLGMIIAMLSAAQLEYFGAGILVADLVVIAFSRELAAVMTAVVVSARTGAAIAAELATMKVQEEIDALRGMGLNVTQFLIAPKVLALLLVMPCLAGLGLLAALLGSGVWGTLVMGHGFTSWYQATVQAVQLDDLMQGFLKTIFFSLTIVLVGCHNGLRAKGGSRDVGLMTTRAVVMDIFSIIVIDMVFATFFYYLLD